MDRSKVSSLFMIFIILFLTGLLPGQSNAKQIIVNSKSPLGTNSTVLHASKAIYGQGDSVYNQQEESGESVAGLSGVIYINPDNSYYIVNRGFGCFDTSELNKYGWAKINLSFKAKAISDSLILQSAIFFGNIWGYVWDNNGGSFDLLSGLASVSDKLQNTYWTDVNNIFYYFNSNIFPNFITPYNDLQFRIGSSMEVPDSLLSYTQPVLTIEAYNPVILVHGFNSSGAIWNDLVFQLDLIGIPYFIFEYGQDTTPPAWGNPLGYATDLKDFVDQIKTDYGYQGKFNLICHSMGALVSRWYIEKLGGDQSIDQWIGIAPVNHGSAWTDQPDSIVKLIYKLKGVEIIGNEPGILAMQTQSDFLARLNYNLAAFDITKWKTIPETMKPGIKRRVIAGINVDLSRTRGVNKDNNRLYHYLTQRGDLLVTLFQTQLQGVDIDVFEGPSANHFEIYKNKDVIATVIEYIKDRDLPSKNNLPPEEDPEDVPSWRCLPSIFYLLFLGPAG
jgi:pimeloyl-ACP methyl ester carboxylesterase